jgi:5'-methylthioadenosine phosphorylase
VESGKGEDGAMHAPGLPPVVGVIGGSGLYEISGLTGAQWRPVASPWGAPSDEFLEGYFDGQRCCFLPRHGRGHPLPPSYLNSRANIDAFKRLGATELISLSACGSLKEGLAPGTFVIVDQFIDRTTSRPNSFFGPGMVAHVGLGRPVCRRLGDAIEQAAGALGLPVVRGGTYVVIEGPQFSTLAESKLYRSWGADVIGMTNMPEARLAREAELCYATVAMVTDYDCWHPEHDHVSVEAIVRVLKDNAEKATALVARLLPLLARRDRSCGEGCHTALAQALITAPHARDPRLVAKLDAVAGRVL